jgi:hypothetical protein
LLVSLGALVIAALGQMTGQFLMPRTNLVAFAIAASIGVAGNRRLARWLRIRREGFPQVLLVGAPAYSFSRSWARTATRVSAARLVVCGRQLDQILPADGLDRGSSTAAPYGEEVALMRVFSSWLQAGLIEQRLPVRMSVPAKGVSATKESTSGEGTRLSSEVSASVRVVGATAWERVVVRTPWIRQGDDLGAVMRRHLAPLIRAGDLAIVSEKAATIAIERSVSLAAVRVGPLARRLASWCSPGETLVG